jgi:hypothetical protein
MATFIGFGPPTMRTVPTTTPSGFAPLLHDATEAAASAKATINVDKRATPIIMPPQLCADFPAISGPGGHPVPEGRAARRARREAW